MSKSSKKPEAAPAETPSAEVIESPGTAAGDSTPVGATSDNPDGPAPGSKGVSGEAGPSTAEGNERSAAGAEETTVAASTAQPGNVVESSMEESTAPADTVVATGEAEPVEGYEMTWSEVCKVLATELKATQESLAELKAWCAKHTHMGAGAQPDSAP